MSFVIVLISKRGYLKTTENKSSCQPFWVACKKNDLTEKSCPNRLGLELKRMQGIIALIRKFTNNKWLTRSVFAKCRQKCIPKLSNTRQNRLKK